MYPNFEMLSWLRHEPRSHENYSGGTQLLKDSCGAIGDEFVSMGGKWGRILKISLKFSETFFHQFWKKIYKKSVFITTTKNETSKERQLHSL